MEDLNIKIGDYVVYINTGTKGRVVDIRKDENGDIWIVLDNNLMYRPHLLKVIEKPIHEKREDIKELAERLEKEEENMEKVIDMDLGDACGAG